MDVTFSFGPLLVPGYLLAAVIAFVTVQVVLLRFRREIPVQTQWVTDRGSTALLLAFAVWKVWPIFTWWTEIMDDPLILLRLPGGRIGGIAGLLAALLFLVPGLRHDRKRIIPTVTAIAALVIGFLLGLAVIETAAAAPELPVTQRLLEETYSDLNGTEQVLLDPARATVITFWASWCSPCRAELPVKKRFFTEHQDVNFLSINLTATESSMNAVHRFVEENGISYPVIPDPAGQLAAMFSVRGTPTTVVIDRNGTITARWSGPSSLDRLERALPAVESPAK